MSAKTLKGNWIWESEKIVRGLEFFPFLEVVLSLGICPKFTPKPPQPCLERGLRERETFLCIISRGEWRLHGDQTPILMRRRLQIRELLTDCQQHIARFLLHQCHGNATFQTVFFFFFWEGGSYKNRDGAVLIMKLNFSKRNLSSKDFELTLLKDIKKV